jgi:hypothetical protein
VINRRTGGLFIPRLGVVRYGRASSDGGGGGSDPETTLGGFTKPNASNTGPTNRAALVDRGTTLTTSSNGQVIQDINFTTTGTNLNIQHNNVVVSNCVFRGRVTVGGENTKRSGITISDSEFINADGLGGGVSLYRCYIHAFVDGDFWRNPGDCTWESCYCTDFVATSDVPHMDVIQWFWSAPQNGTWQAANLVVQGCFFESDQLYSHNHQYNASIFSSDDNGPITNWTARYNWFRVGGFGIRHEGPGACDGTQVIDNNLWLHDDGYDGYAPIRVGPNVDYTLLNFSGNKIKFGSGAVQDFQKPPGTNSSWFKTT